MFNNSLKFVLPYKEKNNQRNILFGFPFNVADKVFTITRNPE